MIGAPPSAAERARAHRSRLRPGYDSPVALFGSRPAGDARLGEAVEECRKRLRADPADGAAALRLADLLSASDGRAEAVGILNRVGARLRKAGRLVEAIAVFKKVEALDPRAEVTSSYLSILELKKLLEAEERGRPPAAPLPESSAADAAATDRRKKSARVHTLRKEVPLLRDVPAFLFELVLEKIRLFSLAPGATLFAEGEPGGTLFFVATGEIDTFARGDAGAPVPLERHGTGDVLGVVPFLSGVPHPESAVARTHADLLGLDRAALAPLVKKHREIADALSKLFSERVLDGALARSRLFGLLPRRDREAVAHRMRPWTVKAGSVVLREGEPGGDAFLVRSGALRVTTRLGGRELALALLTPHELFGDVASLRHGPRTATVTAVTECELLRLPAADLRALLAARPELAPALEEIQLERFTRNAAKLAKGS